MIAFKVIVLLLLSCGTLAIQDPLFDVNNCGIELDFLEDFTTIYYTNAEKTDVDTGEFFRFTLPNNVSETEFKTEFGYEFLRAYQDGRHVIVEPSELFTRIDELTTSDESTEDLRVKMSFQCGDNDYNDITTFTFIQPIIDTNNHEPRFNREVYNFRFGMDIRKGADLSEMLEMYAVDLDMTNVDVYFSIEDNDELEIKTHDRYYDDNKIYHAQLITKKELTSGLKKSYKISVHDTGMPTKVGSAIVKVQID